MMNRSSSLGIAFLVLASATAGGCQKDKPEAPAPAAPAAPAAGAPAAPGGAPAAFAPGPTGNASIAGTVKLNGPAPEMQLTKRQGDPFCAKTPMKEEEVVVGPGGGLKNVVVRIKAGLTGRYDPPATSPVLDQTACMYRPRVQAVVAGQTLQIKNSDQTLHNIHGFKGPSTQFNQAQIPGMGPISRKLTDTDQVLKFKCDVHPWMTAYVIVAGNPFFGVTGDDGSFKITGVPAGKYTVEAWHERYGSKTAEITVDADKPAEASFQYEAK
jgi:plastocyanin